MATFRTFCARHPLIAAMIVAAALLMKLAVPGGFMPVFANGRVAIVACDGVAPVMAATHAMPAVHAMPGMEHENPKHPTRIDTPCVFAALAAPSLAAIDAVLIAFAFAFVLATVSHRDDPVRPAAARNLRPPPRAPPRPA